MEEQGKQRKLLAAAAEYDLLSSLPEPLIHHVLSLLSLKDIVKAAAMCKSWGRTFASFPVLNFRCRDFLKTGEDNTRRTIWERFKRMSRLVDATMTRLQEQPMKIDKFGVEYDLVCEPKDVWLSRIDRWTAVALDNNAQEISIGLSPWGRFSRLRDTVTKAPSLELVALSGSTNSLNPLRSLTLDGLAAGEFLSWGRLMSACGSLESLSLYHCRLKKVRISGLPNLKAVSIAGCPYTRLIEIDAPSLESFVYDDSLGFFRNHPCVVNVNIHSPNLKSLTLQGVAENDGWFRDFLSRFQLLQDLTVIECNSLSSVRISNPLIESIDIKDCTKLTDISIEAPELRRLRLCEWDGQLPSVWMENPPRSGLWKLLQSPDQGYCFFPFEQVEPEPC